MGKLLARITDDMKASLKAGDKDRLQVLRMLIAAIKAQQIDKQKDDLDDAEEQAILEKAVKMRKDTVAQAEAAGRNEIAERERAEVAVIEAYLPQKLSPADLAEKVRALAAEVGYAGPSDGGRFMKEWMARYKGLADGRDVQAELKKVSG
ncbi:MAG: GatB/YqeY domain-containing protein [Planctomycetota bacterium]